MAVEKLLVEAELKNICLVEDFIEHSLLPPDKRLSALIICTELFDNICEHAVLSDDRFIEIRLSHFFYYKLEFRYTSSNFQKLLYGVKSAQPHFDADFGRYRGLGLKMTRNLSRKVYYKNMFGKLRVVVYL